MNATESRSDATYKRAVALLELALHVGRLSEEKRLTNDDGAAVVEMLQAFAFADRADGDA